MARQPLDPHDLVPAITYPSQSSFARRLDDQQDAKQHVASAVEWRFGLSRGDSLLILDGSSSFYVGLAAMHRASDPNQKRATTGIKTVSEALGDELAFSDRNYHVRLHLAEGEVHPDLFTVYGEPTDEFVKKYAEECLYTVVSVNALFSYLGPYGVDSVTVSMKRAVARSKFQRLIFVTDHTKLAKLPNDVDSVGSAVFHDPKEWHALRANERCFVFTTPYPGTPGYGHVATVPENVPVQELAKRGPQDRYAIQAKHLNDAMSSDRFVVVPFCVPGSAVP